MTGAPHTTEFKRFDEAGANRRLNHRWEPSHSQVVPSESVVGQAERVLEAVPAE